MSEQKGVFKYIFLVFAVVILIADFCLIFMHGKSFSDNENRMLQQFPEVSARSALSGRLMSQAEDFVEDQFFLRDQWISFKLDIDKVTGKEESNDVYLGKKGYLLEKAVTPNFEDLDKNLAAINSFAERHADLNIVMSVVPNAVYVCNELLPSGAPSRDQKKDLDHIKNAVSGSLNYVDVTAALKKHNTEELYYKSDHHWTSLGAKYTFDELCGPLGIEEPILEYDIMKVTEDFSGTMASNSGAFNVKDEIDIYVPKTPEDFQYVAEYGDIQKKSATIYNSEALASKNKYEVFMGGNYSYVSIKTTAQTDRNLLLFKDSYANTFIQFLLPYYRNIVIIDPRYYSDDCEKLIDERRITDVLFLYNMNTFALDNSLAGVLEDAAVTEEVAAPEDSATPGDTAVPGDSAASEDTAAPEAVAAPENTAVPETSAAPEE